MFGPIAATAQSAPSIGPDAVTINPSWEARNIETVSIPQLAHLPRTDDGKIRVNKHARLPLVALFNQLERQGLLGQVVTWDGLFVPRRMRGKESLSPHAYGLAFDINAELNPYGADPVPTGEYGSVEEIAAVAAPLGWFWGGWFRTPDPHHFEWTGTAPGRLMA